MWLRRAPHGTGLAAALAERVDEGAFNESTAWNWRETI